MIAERMKSTDWKEFWKKEELSSPSRIAVFPNREDIGMSDGEIVFALNDFFEKQESNLFNMTGIDSEEFPEIIDKDIRAVCLELNSLSFLKTREGCGGHEYDKTGDVSNVGYSEPHIVFYAEEKNPGFEKFANNVDKKLRQFKKSGLPSIENIILEADKWPTKTNGILEYRVRMYIQPTEEWCRRNNKSYMQKPKDPGFYQDWCQENGFEYSEDENDESRKKWYETKKKWWKEREEFGNEYGEYFRSAEARKLRDEFFKAFEYKNDKQ